MPVDSNTRSESVGQVEPWLVEFHRRAATDLPVMNQVGRYLFFATCAFGLSLTVGAICRIADAPRLVTEYAGPAAFLASFLTLRDMSKLWDLARKASQATPPALEERRG